MIPWSPTTKENTPVSPGYSLSIWSHASYVWRPGFNPWHLEQRTEEKQKPIPHTKQNRTELEGSLSPAAWVDLRTRLHRGNVLNAAVGAGLTATHSLCAINEERETDAKNSLLDRCQGEEVGREKKWKLMEEGNTPGERIWGLQSHYRNYKPLTF